jgi:hypothetical protein
MEDALGLHAKGPGRTTEASPPGAVACAFAVLPMDRDQEQEGDLHTRIEEIVLGLMAKPTERG